MELLRVGLNTGLVHHPVPGADRGRAGGGVLAEVRRLRGQFGSVSTDPDLVSWRRSCPMST
jgi:hypothetical protein